jgi:hypothetical protein
LGLKQPDFADAARLTEITCFPLSPSKGPIDGKHASLADFCAWTAGPFWLCVPEGQLVSSGQFPKTHIAPLLDHEAHRIERHAPAAMQFELAVRPVG